MTEQNATSPPLPRVSPSRGKDRELWVGVFVILGMVAVLGALFALTDPATFRSRYIVTTVLADAGGIRRGDSVQMRGVNIGRVQRFRMVPEGVAIRLEIEGQYDIPSDSHVELKSGSLFGAMVAEIIPGESTQRLRGGATLPGSTEAGVLDTAGTLADKAETLMSQAQRLLSDGTVKDVQASAGELRQLLKDLSQLTAEQRNELRDLTGSLRKASAGVERATGPELERSVKRVDSLTQRLDGTAASLDRSSKSLETVLGRLERGEGTLGRLATDDSLYDNLNKAALNINKLTEDIRKQPKRYLKLSLF